MKTRLMHVRANVSHLQTSIEWYTNILGFELDSTYPPEKPTYADFILHSGACFSIMEDHLNSSSARFNFEVEDVTLFWNQLKDTVDIIEMLHTTPYHTKKFTIQDIDGNELGFSECS